MKVIKPIRPKYINLVLTALMAIGMLAGRYNKKSCLICVTISSEVNGKGFNRYDHHAVEERDVAAEVFHAPKRGVKGNKDLVNVRALPNETIIRLELEIPDRSDFFRQVDHDTTA